MMQLKKKKGPLEGEGDAVVRWQLLCGFLWFKA